MMLAAGICRAIGHDCDARIERHCARCHEVREPRRDLKPAIVHVVNLRHNPRRWDLYVGRPGQDAPGPLGNPIRPHVTCRRCNVIHSNGAATLPCYQAWLEEELVHRPDSAASRAFEAARQRLGTERALTLACFCAPKPCHGHVLGRLLVAAVYHNEMRPPKGTP